ncbi:hypothetical protein T484DRAFT_1838348, partial [Baffinella frigidus]
VLRFYCQWDDRNAIYGERRPYVLHFYLEDDTAEVCEVRTPNDGRDSFPKLLRRGKLPKHNTGLAEEDSLGSIYSLVPKAPRRDAAKLMEYAGKAPRRDAAKLMEYAGKVEC